MAASLAAAQGVTVHAVGVGGDEPAPFLVDHPLLGPEIVYEKAAIDETSLRELAQATGGMFWRAADTDALDRAIARIDTLAPSDMTAQIAGDRVSLTPHPLAALATLALSAFAVLSGTRFARLP